MVVVERLGSYFKALAGCIGRIGSLFGVFQQEYLAVLDGMLRFGLSDVRHSELGLGSREMAHRWPRS